MKEYLQLVDTQTPGPRYDVTPLFADYPAFQALVEDIANRFDPESIDLVAGIDALGFILGAAVTFRLGKGFLPVRKAGKLPTQVITATFIDYTGSPKGLEIRADAFPTGTRVLVVDEWVETGAQVKAAIDLIERLGGQVAGVATLNMDDNPGTREIRAAYPCFTASEGM